MMSYTVTPKVCDAAYPRHFGSTLLTLDRLKLAYNLYNTIRKPASEEFIAINLVFAHGTGANKSLWKYYIEKLYTFLEEQQQQAWLNPELPKWYLKSVLSIDSASHGDSALLNHRKLGWQNRWEDGGRDLNSVLRHEQAHDNDMFLNGPRQRTILVGHSLGACQAVFAAAYEPMMYDTIFMMETVAYTDEKSDAVFEKMIMRMGHFIKDEFSSEQELDYYFTKVGIMKKFHPKVLQDILDDEKYQSSDGKWHTKASTPQQLTSYMSGAASIPAVMRTLPLLRTPVVHVAALKGRFNPPRTREFVRKAIPAEFLKAIDNVEGEHNLNGERPDEMIEDIKGTLLDRAYKAHANLHFYPEVKYNGDRDKILQEKWKMMMLGGYNVEERPKL